VRHLAPAELRAFRGSTALSRFALGLIGTGLFVVPVVNLAAPVISAAMATHWFHRGRT
jgi:CysZ protein